MFKKITFVLILYIFFHAPRQGQTTNWEQNFDVNGKALSLCPFVASFKTLSLKSDLIRFYNIAPEEGQTTIWGQNFDFNRKALSLCLFVASFKKSLCGLILYIFFMFLYTYIAPGQG